jgi:hypothetical protein
MPEIADEEQLAHLGKGLAFPLRLSVQGGIQTSSLAQKVKEAIWIILRTGQGERLYRPNFGSRLAELAFAPLNSETLLRIRLYVTEALEIWEPRIAIEEVRADPDPVRGQFNSKFKIQNSKFIPTPHTPHPTPYSLLPTPY